MNLSKELLESRFRSSAGVSKDDLARCPRELLTNSFVSHSYPCSRNASVTFVPGGGVARRVNRPRYPAHEGVLDFWLIANFSQGLVYVIVDVRRKYAHGEHDN